MRTAPITDETITWVQRGQTIFKAQDDPCSIGFDWSTERRIPAVPVIATSVWSVAGGDGLLRVEQPAIDQHKTCARVVGGTPGQMYVVTNRTETHSTPAMLEDRACILACVACSQ